VEDFPRITSLKIDGFKVFENFEAKLGPLEVVVGANGAGKSSLFELLRFLREGMEREIPPEIVPGGLGMQLFHSPESPRFSWLLDIAGLSDKVFSYFGALIGPAGVARFDDEGLAVDGGVSVPFGHLTGDGPPKRLELGLFKNEQTKATYYFIDRFSLYSSFKISSSKIRRSSLVEQDPQLREDGGNLSSILHYFATEHFSILEDLRSLLRLIGPGFQSLTVKARGGPGEVMAFWREEGVDADLTLADLSDGILRFLCWAVLCLHPKPPTLICIDEPELGLHPRVLPLLAGLFQKASERTQIILATHSSYFLSQFPLENIAVMRKEDGRAVWIKPADHQVFRDILSDFGQDEISHLHISGELEGLA
jgi:predicted ATPase